MSTVLFLIHIPYDENSHWNDEILRKKRDLEEVTEIVETELSDDESVQSDKEEVKGGEYSIGLDHVQARFFWSGWTLFAEFLPS